MAQEFGRGQWESWYQPQYEMHHSVWIWVYIDHAGGAQDWDAQILAIKPMIPPSPQTLDSNLPATTILCVSYSPLPYHLWRVLIIFCSISSLPCSSLELCSPVSNRVRLSQLSKFTFRWVQCMFHFLTHYPSSHPGTWPIWKANHLTLDLHRSDGGNSRVGWVVTKDLNLNAVQFLFTLFCWAEIITKDKCEKWPFKLLWYAIQFSNGNHRVQSYQNPSIAAWATAMGRKWILEWSYISCKLNIFTGVLVREWSMPLVC